MSEEPIRYPLLDKLYHRYLSDENSADFIRNVSKHYGMAALQRLADGGHRVSRRGAVLAIGFLGDFSMNETMGHALSDSDRAVRLLADHGIRQIWQRQGTAYQRSAIQNLYRLVSRNELEEVIDQATIVIVDDPTLGEAWNQRAIALCAIGDYEAAIADCREALNCNRYHFPSAMGMAHCCLEMDDAYSALDCFRLAISIYPDLEHVRNQISRLERILKN